MKRWSDEIIATAMNGRRKLKIEKYGKNWRRPIPKQGFMSKKVMRRSITVKVQTIRNLKRTCNLGDGK